MAEGELGGGEVSRRAPRPADHNKFVLIDKNAEVPRGMRVFAIDDADIKSVQHESKPGKLIERFTPEEAKQNHPRNDSPGEKEVTKKGRGRRGGVPQRQPILAPRVPRPGPTRKTKIPPQVPIKEPTPTPSQNSLTDKVSKSVKGTLTKKSIAGIIGGILISKIPGVAEKNQQLKDKQNQMLEEQTGIGDPFAQNDLESFFGTMSDGILDGAERRRRKKRPCPYDYMRARDGSRCGERSAESRGPTTGYDTPIGFFDRFKRRSKDSDSGFQKQERAAEKEYRDRKMSAEEGLKGDTGKRGTAGPPGRPPKPPGSNVFWNERTQEWDTDNFNQAYADAIARHQRNPNKETVSGVAALGLGALLGEPAAPGVGGVDQMSNAELSEIGLIRDPKGNVIPKAPTMSEEQVNSMLSRDVNEALERGLDPNDLRWEDFEYHDRIGIIEKVKADRVKNGIDPRPTQEQVNKLDSFELEAAFDSGRITEKQFEAALSANAL